MISILGMTGALWANPSTGKHHLYKNNGNWLAGFHSDTKSGCKANRVPDGGRHPLNILIEEIYDND